LQILDLVRFAELVCLSQELNIVYTASRVSVSLIDYALNKANLDVFNVFLPKNITNSVKNLTLIGRLDFYSQHNFFQRSCIFSVEIITNEDYWSFKWWMVISLSLILPVLNFRLLDRFLGTYRCF
jgi:hypothetical protein